MTTLIAHIRSTYPEPLQSRLLQIRALILATALENSRIGTLSETLKWGQPSFATHPKTGTPIRIDGDSEAKTYSLYVACSTNLIETFRDTHPDMFDYHGNREIRFSLETPFPESDIKLFIAAALTYYL